MKKCAIIVAGGSGTRMGAPLPKQYLEIGGKPILMHTLLKFYEFSSSITLILVIPSADMDLWRQLCSKHDFSVPHTVVAGGQSRFQSVKNGLDAVDVDHGLVAIHDGVRPFVSVEVISKSFEEAAISGSAIAVAPLKDSIRKINSEGGSTFQDRQLFRLVQTPQTFSLVKIKRAFQTEELSIFTDDATVYEHQGWEVSLIPGNPENIKITTPEDMDYADYIISRQKAVDN
jgi:2-C-methyl-D-erythritol 4-phosphate cytidylyltransferase